MPVNDGERSYDGKPARVITIENEALRVDILPEIGSKIYSIVYKPLAEQVLWHNPIIAPHRTSKSDLYDDHWSGGWDDLFPNDEAAFPQTWNFPDHGELWSAAWNTSVQSSGDDPAVHLQVACPMSNVTVEKRISLARSAPEVQVSYRLISRHPEPVPFLFKLHPALAVRAGDRITLPSRRYVLEPRFLGTLDRGEKVFDAPVFEQESRTVDIRAVPPASSKEIFFIYGTELTGESVLIESEARQMQIRLQFPPEFFKTCWLFASYGGWNDYYVAVPEPCNGYPFRLEEAVENGTAAWLHPGKEMDLSARLRIEEYRG